MPDWLPVAETDDTPVNGQPLPASVEAELMGARLDREFVSEAYADLEALYRDDTGWNKLGAEADQLTDVGRKKMADMADLMATGNALIKRGVALRTAYVWGNGVTVSIRDDGAVGQDVNAVWQTFWDEPSNRRELTSSEAQARYERRLATGGEAFWAFPTEPLTGRVRVRKIPAHEIKDRVCDPEDAATVWLYKRVWSAVVVKDDGSRGTQERTTYYPALGFSPASRPTRYHDAEIRWDAPMRPVMVNVPESGNQWRGLGDVLAALPWARMDKEFLEDLAVYMRQLARILGVVSSKSGRTAKNAAGALRDAAASTPTNPGGAPAGAWAASTSDTTMSLLSKSGAQIDSGSSKPHASRAAAALEVPVTMLIADPGTTGSRSTAETLDQPTELMARLRQEVHAEFFRDIANYVIDRAVIAPAGPLLGQVAKDGDRIVVTLPDDDERTVEVDWPSFDSTPLDMQVSAISTASDTGVMPELETFKLLAKALGIEDIDQLIDDLTDDAGNWIGPADLAATAAADRLRDGGDPAEVL